MGAANGGSSLPASLVLVLMSTMMIVHKSAAFIACPATAASSALSSSALFARMPMGPVARAKKMADPADYERVVKQKMQQDKLTRQQAEDEYNQFLENPPFYYALDQRKKRYAELGYKDMFEGMIGEAEKEGRGDEVKERIQKFRTTSKVKAYSVLAVAIGSFFYFRTVYQADPENFLPGI